MKKIAPTPTLMSDIYSQRTDKNDPTLSRTYPNFRSTFQKSQPFVYVNSNFEIRFLAIDCSKIQSVTFWSKFSHLSKTRRFLIILPVRGATFNASEHSFTPSIV